MTMTEHDLTPSVIGVLDLSDVVLASLSSTAAPEIVAEVPEAPEPVAAEAEAKPKAPTSEVVAYVHVPDCIACHACEAECPVGAIEVVDNSVIDPSICDACNKCIPVCPTNCISLQPRSGYAQLEFAITK